MKGVGFYLTTYGRGLKKQKTFFELPVYLQRKVVFVIYPEEYDEFKNYNVMIYDGNKSLSKKRQFVIIMLRRSLFSLWMMIVFFIRSIKKKIISWDLKERKEVK